MLSISGYFARLELDLRVKLFEFAQDLGLEYAEVFVVTVRLEGPDDIHDGLRVFH